MEMLTAGNGYFKSIWKSLRKNRYQNNSAYNNPNFDYLELMQNDELRYILVRYEFVMPLAIEHYIDLIELGDKIINEIKKYKTSK